MPSDSHQPSLKWSTWQAVSPAVHFPTPDTLALTLMGGQAFRWEVSGNQYTGVWGECVARLRLNNEGLLEWSAPTTLKRSVNEALPHYLAAECPLPSLIDCLPWRSDKVLAHAIQHLPGLRLLRQPLPETLLCYLCSSTKRITQIREGCHKMAKQLGETIIAGYHALPTWHRLSQTTEAELRQCGLGYRAKFIKASATQIASEPDYFATLAKLPYPQARDKLMQLPGVGGKIADCVLLYSGVSWEAFPTDTWILQVMAKAYGLHDWKPEMVAHFGRIHFGKYAGLAQQYLFEAGRHAYFDSLN